MDIAIKKKHPFIRYWYYIFAIILFVAFVVFVYISTSGPKKLKYEADKVEIEEVKHAKFLEYLDAEGIVRPILTIKINTLETGIVERIVSDDGSLLEKGDTILFLQNPELVRTIEDENDNLEKQRISHQEKQLEMKRRSSQLKRQTMETTYKLERLNKQYSLDQEEYKLGIKSKAELSVASDEYNFNQKNSELLLEELRHDSLMNLIQTDLMKNDLLREEKSFLRSKDRLNQLIVCAPMSGQLSFLSVIPGERVGAGSSIGELKVIDDCKIHTKISEYYIDRITPGLSAMVLYQGEKYPLKITKINPEVKERQFEIDLVFTGEKPENIRIGKSFRIQIELGLAEDALIVNKGNFFQNTGGQWIFKLNESGHKAVKTPVVFGRQNPRQYEILEGLKEGDKVIVSGYDVFGEAEEIVLE